MQPALFYEEVISRRVQCLLCPHRCIIAPGQTGHCGTRMNRAGHLFSRSYGVLSAIASDPVEKKPLYHLLPGSQILSIGSCGCNFTCDFCQNCEISQPDPLLYSQFPVRDPGDMVDKALLYRNNAGIAYTYNEPTVYYEYMLDCAILVKKQHLANVMVTNGFINREPLERLLPYMDAFNIDLKSFREEFYKRRTSGTLRPVLDTITRVASSGSHLELTFLIIPGENDTAREWKEMIGWIADNCGPDTVLHASRYYPRHKLKKNLTPTSSIHQFLELAREKLHYVYPGNTPQIDSHTRCPGCGNILIEREMYHTRVTGMDGEGRCAGCGYKVYGVFKRA